MTPEQEQQIRENIRENIAAFGAAAGMSFQELSEALGTWAGRIGAAAWQLSGFTCPCCRRTSHHPDDLANGYCGACHWWTADPELGPEHLKGPCPARSA